MKKTVKLISMALCSVILLGFSSKTDSKTNPTTSTTSKQQGKIESKNGGTKEIMSTPGKSMEENVKLVYEFLKKCETYYLATVEGDQPRVRPFGTVNIFEGKLYIQTGKVKNVSKQIQANPKVELCAYADGKWLRVAGKLVRDERVEAKKNMLDSYPSLKSMYSPEDDNTEVLFFEEATATFYSFTEQPQVIKFGAK